MRIDGCQAIHGDAAPSGTYRNLLRALEPRITSLAVPLLQSLGTAFSGKRQANSRSASSGAPCAAAPPLRTGSGHLARPSTGPLADGPRLFGRALDQYLPGTGRAQYTIMRLPAFPAAQGGRHRAPSDCDTGAVVYS